MIKRIASWIIVKGELYIAKYSNLSLAKDLIICQIVGLPWRQSDAKDPYIGSSDAWRQSLQCGTCNGKMASQDKEDEQVCLIFIFIFYITGYIFFFYNEYLLYNICKIIFFCNSVVCSLKSVKGEGGFPYNWGGLRGPTVGGLLNGLGKKCALHFLLLFSKCLHINIFFHRYILSYCIVRLHIYLMVNKL